MFVELQILSARRSRFERLQVENLFSASAAITLASLPASRQEMSRCHQPGQLLQTK